jgi:predicted DNA-binding transcriptional regulator AlpA
MTRRHHLDRRAGQLLANAPQLNADTLLSTRELADLLGVSQQWLELGRKRGYGPPWVRLGPHTIRYPYGKVIKWLRTRSGSHAA